MNKRNNHWASLSDDAERSLCTSGVNSLSFVWLLLLAALDALMLTQQQPPTPSTLSKQDSRSRDAERVRETEREEVLTEV